MVYLSIYLSTVRRANCPFLYAPGTCGREGWRSSSTLGGAHCSLPSDGDMPKKEGQEGSGVFVPSPAANAVLTALFGAEVLGALYALNAGVAQALCCASRTLVLATTHPPAHALAAQARYRRSLRWSRRCALSRSLWRAC